MSATRDSAGAPPSIRILRDVVVPLHDGTRTLAEIWLPNDGRPHPAILVRTPYLKEVAAQTCANGDPRLATARGYAVVLQDVRGRGGSEGTFEPFVHEEADGADSVAWVAAQPWCDGEVVMAGSSYVGATQWLAAAGAPPALRAIAPALSSDEYGEGWSYTAGVAEHAFLASWCALELAPLAERMFDEPSQSWEDVAATEALTPWLAEWLAHRPESNYWRARSISRRRAELTAPALIAAGWYDIFLSASLRSFARSRDPRDRLVIGPWAHDGDLSHLVGNANLGIAGRGAGTLTTWMLDFYDAVLADRALDLSPVTAYALGLRRWVDLDAWPPADAQPLAAPLDDGTFAVDPGAPVPTRGGRGLQVLTPGWGRGIFDQRPLLNRADVHVAARITLEEHSLLAGPVAARLATSAQGDGRRLWVATLCIQQPDGALHNLVEGVAAAPADATSVDVELGDTLAWLPAGSTLVLLLAGSSYPRWPRPATAGLQRLHTGSCLQLTVAPDLHERLVGDRNTVRGGACLRPGAERRSHGTVARGTATRG